MFPRRIGLEGGAAGNDDCRAAALLPVPVSKPRAPDVTLNWLTPVVVPFTYSVVFAPLAMVKAWLLPVIGPPVLICPPEMLPNVSPP